MAISSSTLTPEQLGRLKFITGTYRYISGKTRYAALVHTVSDKTYDKMVGFLKGNSPASMATANMKAYIISDGTLKGADIAAVCKKKNIKITKDITKADLIIGNDNCVQKIYESNFNKLGILEVHFINCHDECKDAVTKFLHDDLKVAIELEYNEQILVSRKHGIHKHYPDGVDDYRSCDTHVIHDDFLSLIYYALDKKIPVVNDVFLFGSLDKITLDEESYETLVNMYKSSNSEEHAVANSILFNCDYNKSMVYIWHLWDDFRYRIDNRREKICQTFKDGCVNFLYDSQSSVYHKAAKENVLPEKMYTSYMTELTRKIYSRAKDYSSMPFQVSVAPTYTYHEFLKQQQLETVQENPEVED